MLGDEVHGCVGVSTGMAFCGVIGSKFRREYTLMGDAVNLSARLMGKGMCGVFGVRAYAGVQEGTRGCQRCQGVSGVRGGARGAMGYEGVFGVRVGVWGTRVSRGTRGWGCLGYEGVRRVCRGTRRYPGFRGCLCYEGDPATPTNGKMYVGYLEYERLWYEDMSGVQWMSLVH